MNHPIEAEIMAAEEELRQAMLHSDVAVLDRLIADDLICTSHLGQPFTKQADLEAHRSGLFKISSISFAERQIRLLGEAAIVAVRVNLVGAIGDVPTPDDFRFTRVWGRSATGAWQVVAAHIGLVMQ